MNIGSVIGFGVLTAIIAAILIKLFGHVLVVQVGRYFIDKIINIPQSRNISGVWETEFWKSGHSYKEIAKVSEILGKVWGTVTYQKGAQKRKYRMTGSIKEGILVATYEIVSPREVLDRGSFTLALSKDGSTLKGCYSWTDDDRTAPKGNRYIWTRPAQRGLNGMQVRKSKIHGKGVFANREYPDGSEVGEFEGYEVEKDTRHSLTIGGHKIEPTGPLKFLNHSCNPNSYFKGRKLITNRDIKQGQELTINYLATETHLTHPFKCKCNTKECSRRIC